MMTQTTEQRLINYLVDNEVDYAAIGRKLAKQEPALFLALVDGTVHIEWIRTKYAAVLGLMRRGDQVPAIKELRGITGFGLKDAVDIVRGIMQRAVDNGHVFPVNFSLGRAAEEYRSDAVAAGNEKLMLDLEKALGF